MSETNNRPEEYSGWYTSTDEKKALGLCAGLAHKQGMGVGTVRAIVVIASILTLTGLAWWYLLLGLLFKKLPTKDIA